MAYKITPAEVSRLLTSSGLSMTERRLVDWRVKGWLPSLDRMRPPKGVGPRAEYGWTNPDVLTQAFSLVALLELRGRMETASLLTWFAGFEYPIEQMRTAWVAFEEKPWENTMRWASQGSASRSSIEDTVEVLVLENKASPLGKKLSHDFVRTSTRLALDPDFEPTIELSLEQAERIRRDLPQYFRRSEMAGILPLIRPEHIKKFVEFMQDYLSKPKLAALIRSLSLSQLEAVHRDCHFMLGLYRAWLADAIAEASSGGQPDELAFEFGPRIAWRLGRFFMLVDIALRRMGVGPQIEATVDYFAEFASEQENRQLMAHIRRNFQEVAAVSGDDLDRVREEFEWRWKDDPNSERIYEVLGRVVRDLTAIWGPVVKPLGTAFAQAASIDLARETYIH